MYKNIYFQLYKHLNQMDSLENISNALQRLNWCSFSHLRTSDNKEVKKKPTVLFPRKAS